MSLINLELDERLFQSYTVSFSIRADDPKSVDLLEDTMLEFSGDRFFVTDVIKERTDAQALHSIIGEAGWMRLADLKRPGSFRLEAVTPAVGLTTILADTGWIVSQATTDATTYTFDATDASVLDLLWQWAKVTGNEIRFQSRTKSLVFLATIGADKGYTFSYGRNLTSIKRTSSAPKITRLYAFGRNEIDIASLNSGVPYLEDYTFYTDQGVLLADAQANYRKDEIWADDSFIEVAALYAAAVARMATLSQPTLIYEASVADFSEQLNISDYDFQVGDYVRVYDEILNINVDARVSRRVVYPLEPHRNKVELAFNPILLPDPNANSARADTTREWELFESRNRNTLRQVRQGSTILHRLVLTVSDSAEWVAGFKLVGTAVGASILTIEVTNDTDSSVVWPTFSESLTNGQVVEYNFTFGEKEIPAGEYIMVIRAYSDTAAAGINIAEGDTAYWYLARGTTRDAITLPNSERFDFNGSADGTGGSIQTFIVPDDVSEILVEAHGAQGGNQSYGGGLGGKVVARFPVIAGNLYDVYCGGGYGPGAGANNGLAGWPNGGAAAGLYTRGYAGGGSTHLVLSGGAMASALIVAAGGGGCNEYGASRTSSQAKGGYGGFYQGGDGWGLTPIQTEGVAKAGLGASQIAGGAGYNSPTEGQDGTFGQGGDSFYNNGFFDFGPGGGGGGWYGGGGAGEPTSHGGGSYAGDGGGGSGWVDATGYDLELQDDENSGNGYMIISWDTPDAP